MTSDSINEANETGKSKELKIIAYCEEKNLPYLDLNNVGLIILPREVLNLSHVQWLFLKDNCLDMFPEDIFGHLLHLNWLDLRNNRLKEFSGTHLSSSVKLETLLLEENELTSLPLQLGLLNNLKCISLSGNPLRFPSIEVISQGTLYIRNYLRDALGTVQNEKSNLEIYENYASTSDSIKMRSNQSNVPDRLEFCNSASSVSSRDALSMDLAECAGASSIKLHPPINHYQIRQQYMERVARGSGAPRQFSNNLLRTQSERHNRLVNMHPAPTSFESIEKRALEDKRAVRLRELNDRQDAILQRRRNQESLRDWRDHGKRLQQQSYMEQMKKGKSQVANESVKRIELAPFDVTKDQMGLPSHDEYRRAVAAGSVPRDAKPKPLSADKVAMMEADRKIRVKHIQAEIQKHSKEIQERKSHPLGSAQEEIEVARRDLQIMHMLRRAINSPSSGLFTS